MKTQLVPYFLFIYILSISLQLFAGTPPKRPQPQLPNYSALQTLKGFYDHSNQTPASPYQEQQEIDKIDKKEAMNRLLSLSSSETFPTIKQQDNQSNTPACLICLPSTKHPFEIIESFIPNTDATKFFIKTENSSRPSEYYLKGFELYVLDEIFAKNPQCTILFVDLNNQSSYDNTAKTFAINRQIIPYQYISQFKRTKSLQQESDLHSSLSLFANELTKAFTSYKSKPWTIDVKTINFSPENNDANSKTEKENEVIIVDQQMYLKQYDILNGRILLLGDTNRDFGLVKNLYWDQDRGNIQPKDSCNFSITTTTEKVYHISYITCNNKTVSLSYPVQKISYTADKRLEQDYHLSIDLNNIVHLHDKETKQPLYCTKEQITQIKKATSQFFITLPEEKLYHITAVHYATGEHKALSNDSHSSTTNLDTDGVNQNNTFTIQFLPFLPRNASEIVELFVDNSAPKVTQMKVKFETDNKHIIQNSTYYLSPSHIHAIDKIFGEDNTLERISLLITTNNQRSNDSKSSCFILSRSVFDEFNTSDIQNEKNEEEIERIVKNFQNIRPTKPKTSKLTPVAAITEIVPTKQNKREQSEPEKEAEITTIPAKTSYFSSPLFIGVAALAITSLLTFLFLRYTQTIAPNATT